MRSLCPVSCSSAVCFFLPLVIFLGLNDSFEHINHLASIDLSLLQQPRSGCRICREILESRSTQDFLNVFRFRIPPQKFNHPGAFVKPSRADEQCVFRRVVGVHAVHAVPVVCPIHFVKVASKAAVSTECLSQVVRQVEGRLGEPSSDVRNKAMCPSSFVGAVPSCLPDRRGNSPLLFLYGLFVGLFICVLKAESDPRPLVSQ